MPLPKRIVSKEMSIWSVKVQVRVKEMRTTTRGSKLNLRISNLRKSLMNRKRGIQVSSGTQMICLPFKAQRKTNIETFSLNPIEFSKNTVISQT